MNEYAFKDYIELVIFAAIFITLGYTIATVLQILDYRIGYEEGLRACICAREVWP